MDVIIGWNGAKNIIVDIDEKIWRCINCCPLLLILSFNGQIRVVFKIFINTKWNLATLKFILISLYFRYFFIRAFNHHHYLSFCSPVLSLSLVSSLVIMRALKDGIDWSKKQQFISILKTSSISISYSSSSTEAY
jgi:hypothetical protein